jgi:hypothetical protein
LQIFDLSIGNRQSSMTGILNTPQFYQPPPRPQTEISTISASGRGLTQIHAGFSRKISGQRPPNMVTSIFGEPCGFIYAAKKVQSKKVRRRIGYVAHNKAVKL